MCEKDMKIFVWRFCRFILPCVAFCLAITLSAFFAYRCLYLSKIKIPEGVKYVVVGDSQAACAVSPKTFPALMNVAAPGLSLLQAYYKITDILKVNDNRDFTIVLDMSPSRLDMPLKPLSLEDFSSRYAFLNLLHCFDPYDKGVNKPFLMVRAKIIRDGLKLVFREWFPSRKRKAKSDKTPWGGFLPMDEAMYVTDPEAAASMVDEYAQSIMLQHSFKTGSQENLKLLSRIVETVQASQKEIIIVTTPWHKSLVKVLPKDYLADFLKQMSEFSVNSGVVWHNDLEFICDDNCYADQNHLNRTGAEIYTRSLFGRITKE